MILLWALAASLPVGAHHSFVSFDPSRTTTVHGTVRAFEWENPHVWLWVISDEAPSKGATFAFEWQSINELKRFNGLSKQTLSVGDRITVLYAPLRNGKRGGGVLTITLANGRVLGGPPPETSAEKRVPASGAAPHR